MPKTALEWSCDERDRKHCRNGHGCHCREITILIREREAAILVQRNTSIALDGLREALTCARNQDGFLDFPRYARELIERALGEREYDPNVAPCDDAEFGAKP